MDLKLLDRMRVVQCASLGAAGGIALIILSGWLAPAIGSRLHWDWDLMKANMALGILLSSAALPLMQLRESVFIRLTGRLSAVIVVKPSGTTLLGHATGRSLRGDIEGEESLAELTDRADKVMYERKRMKKSGTPSALSA